MKYSFRIAMDFLLILFVIAGGFLLMASGMSSTRGNTPDVAGWGLALMIFAGAVSLTLHKRAILVWIGFSLTLLLSLLFVVATAGLIPTNLPVWTFIIVLLLVAATPLILLGGLIVNCIQSLWFRNDVEV